MEDYKSGACKLKEAQELAAIQAETLKQQNENQKPINEQLAEKEDKSDSENFSFYKTYSLS